MEIEEEHVLIKDEMGIFVKEEETIVGATATPDYEEDASINIADLLVQPWTEAPQIKEPQKELLVYTTRLDDMNVWHYISTYRYSNRVLDAILTESKPNLPKKFIKTKKRKNKTQFKKLLAHLDVYKQKVDVSHYYTGYIVTTCNFRSLPEVYFIDGSGIPTGLFRTVEYVISNPYIPRVGHNYCCWFKRNTLWKEMNWEGCTARFTFMRIPHPCDLGNCICCCRRKYTYVSQFATPKSTQRPAKCHLKNRWLQRLLYRREQQKTNSLINAALVHKRVSKTPTQSENLKKHYRDSCLKFICNNKQTHGYHLGQNCLINTYIRPNTFSTLQYFNDMIGTWISPVESTNICCLTEYKKYCLTLTKLAHPTVVNFLINSSINVPNECDGCKNTTIHNAGSSTRTKILSTLYYLPKYPKHTKPFSKFSAMRAVNILQEEIYMQTYNFFNTVIDNTNYNSMESNLPHASQNIPGENFSNTVIDNTNCNSIESNLPHASQNIPEYNVQSCTASTQNKNINSNFIDLGIENIRLTIFPGGKVKILTKTPVDEISTENLKILREIIHHVQNKVLSQNFSPFRSIDVNNVFTNNNEKQVASSNILCSVLNTTKKSQHHLPDVSKYTPDNNDITNSVQEPNEQMTYPYSKLIKQDNFYETLTKVEAEKRKQYLMSYEFLKNNGINLWATVNGLDTTRLELDEKTNSKRKTLDKGTSPPPKQIRKEPLEKKTGVVPMTSINTPRLSTIPPPKVYTETIQQPQTTPFIPLPTNVPTQAVPTTSLMVPNAPFAFQQNFTVIPIGQLPQELVASLYQKYAFQVQPQNLTPTTGIEHLPTISLLDDNKFVHNSDVTSIPTQLENTDDVDSKEDDCILGV